jgi:hypothetical protein
MEYQSELAISISVTIPWARAAPAKPKEEMMEYFIFAAGKGDDSE